MVEVQQTRHPPGCHDDVLDTHVVVADHFASLRVGQVRRPDRVWPWHKVARGVVQASEHPPDLDESLIGRHPTVRVRRRRRLARDETEGFPPIVPQTEWSRRGESTGSEKLEQGVERRRVLRGRPEHDIALAHHGSSVVHTTVELFRHRRSLAFSPRLLRDRCAVHERFRSGRIREYCTAS